MKVVVIPSWYKDPDRPMMGSFFRQQSAYIARQGVDVAIVYYENRSLSNFSFNKLVHESHFQIEESETDGIREFCIKGWSPMPKTFIGNAIWNFFTQRALKRYIAKHGRPDLIHVHSTILGGHIANICKQKHHIPYVITEHFSGFIEKSIPSFLEGKIAKAFRNADKIIAVSQPLKEAIEQYANGEISVIPNMIDTVYFKPDAEKQPSNDRKFTFLSIGNLVPLKNFSVLLDAFKIVSEQYPSAELQIVGEGSLAKHLRNKKERLGLSKTVFSGRLPQDQVRESLHNCNAFVLASSIETFGIVFVEALAAGKPIIATRCGGPNNIVNDENGFLVEPKNVQELSAAMIRMIERYRQYDPLALESYAYSNFDYRVLSKRIIDIYNNIVK